MLQTVGCSTKKRSRVIAYNLTASTEWNEKRVNVNVSNLYTATGNYFASYYATHCRVNVFLFIFLFFFLPLFVLPYSFFRRVVICVEGHDCSLSCLAFGKGRFPQGVV